MDQLIQMIALFTKNSKLGSNNKSIMDRNLLAISIWNSRLASSTLVQVILDFNNDLTFIQEPYTYNNNGIIIPNVPSRYYVRHCLNHVAAYGAVITISQSSNNVIGIEIYTNLETFKAYSIYCRPTELNVLNILAPIFNVEPTIIK